MITEAIIVGAIQARRKKLGLPPWNPLHVSPPSTGTVALIDACGGSLLSEPRLPSGDAALRLMRGKPGSVLGVLETMGARSVLAAVGLTIAGFTGKKLLLATLGSVLGIELGVLGWAWLAVRRERGA